MWYRSKNRSFLVSIYQVATDSGLWVKGRHRSLLILLKMRQRSGIKVVCKTDMSDHFARNDGEHSFFILGILSTGSYIKLQVRQIKQSKVMKAK